MYNTKAYSVAEATGPLNRTSISRRDPTDGDVQIEILFCCRRYSDLRYAYDDWHDVMPVVYPVVPDHEIAGRVAKVGSGVRSTRSATSRRSAAL